MKDKYGGSTDYSAENGSTVSSSPPLLHQERHHIVLTKQRSQQQQQQQQQCSLFNLNGRLNYSVIYYLMDEFLVFLKGGGGEFQQIKTFISYKFHNHKETQLFSNACR